jgi:hypothetical protein
MQNDPLEEILEEERQNFKNPKQRKKPVRRKNGCARILLLLTLLVLVILGAIYVLQAYLEVEAKIEAIRLATQYAAPQETAVPKDLLTETPQPATATSNLMAAHTATISAQLTAVAEFQLTLTPNP